MSWIQDAGHGGSDPGAVAKGNIEKVYTLEAALYVDKRLGELGISSDVTRYNDSTLSQTERTSKVKKHKKAISHHYNAGGGSGFEAIHSIYSNGQFEHLLAEEFRKAGYPVRPRPVYFRKNGSGTGDYYYMHRQTSNCRTTIVEYEFVDGPQAEKIKDKSYREGMYECVVRAICRDEGVTYKSNKKAEPNKETPKQKEEPFMLEKAVVFNSLADYSVAESVANRYKIPMITHAVAKQVELAKELIVVGGSKEGLKADKFTVLSGKDRFETAAKVAKYLK